MPYFNLTTCFRASIHVGRGAARRYLSDSSERIYISSDSTTAQFIAHSLRAGLNPPAVTTLYHVLPRYRQWKSSPGYIALHDDRYGDCIKQKVDAELARPPFRRHNKIVTIEEVNAEGLWKPHYDAKPTGQTLDDEPLPKDRYPDQTPIKHLIVAGKPQFFEPNLLSVKHRLNQDTTILLVSSMLGILEKLVENVFVDPATRPKFMLGEFTHLVARPSRTREYGHPNLFQIMHTKPGKLFITRYPLFKAKGIEPDLAEGETALPSQTDYLVDVLLRAQALSTFEMPPLMLHMRQLDAIALRSIIEPLTALVDCTNGGLLFNHHLKRSMRLLIAETSLIIRSLPEIRGHPNAETRYGPDRLELIIGGMMKRTSNNVNGTVLDVRRGYRTNVDFVNGYLIDRAEELGLKAFMNFMMQELVKGKAMMVAHTDYSGPVQIDAPE